MGFLISTNVSILDETKFKYKNDFGIRFVLF